MTATPAIGTLMLIDDDMFDQKLSKRLIVRSQLVGRLLGFLSAEEALDFLRDPDRPRVDAILLDVNMPRMDGFEFLDAATKELGDGFADIVVMMLTTSLDPRDFDRARQYSVVKDYFSKPLSIAYLEKIAALLEREPG